MMKRTIIFSLLIVVVMADASFSQQSKDGEYFIGTFDGRTPCRELAVQLQEKVGHECIKIKWRLTGLRV
jgi:hypothetical protein